MSERKTIHRVFWEWDFEKEERWLNEMAMNGWALEKAYFATYIFAPCEPAHRRCQPARRADDFHHQSAVCRTAVLWPWTHPRQERKPGK